jgi:hypothetical protein
MGGSRMRGKIVGIIIFMLLTTPLLSTAVIAGNEENPEITDSIGDARPYLDINKAWFYENPSTPDILYTTIKIVKTSVIPFKQHLVVRWKMNGEYYASMLGIGYNFQLWFEYVSIIGRGTFGDPKPIITTIEGNFDRTNGTVTCKIPKSTIGNPQPGDVLTDTQSQCFERFRFWGRLGFSPLFRNFIFDAVLEKWQIDDIAPDLDYGSDYIIQY